MTGTGFIEQYDGVSYLVTNRHVLSNRTASGDYVISLVDPDVVSIFHNKRQTPGEWIRVDEPLLDEQGLPLWLEHPHYGHRVDVVALPLTHTDDADLYPYIYSDPAEQMQLRPSDMLSIVGFPFGLAAGGSFAIWIKGFLASEPSQDYGGLPRFLVDARTRSGQSGSPVLAHSTGGPTTYPNGNMVWDGQERTYLVGIYSGRINEQSDLGIVWKTSLLTDILVGQKRHSPPVYE